MNAIVIICIGKAHQQFYQISKPTIEAYARKVGAELIEITEQTTNTISPHFEKFQIYDLLIKYQRILYLDIDLIIRDDCPNLFELVPEDKIGLFDESPHKNHIRHMVEASQTYKIKIEKDYDGSYYNTGVFILSRMHRDLFQPPTIQSIHNHQDQSYLNLKIQQTHTRVHKLHHRLNRTPIVDETTGDHRLNAHIIHYAGILQNAQRVMHNDLQRWKQGETQIQPKAILAIGARLGDITCAEPIIRYLATKQYPEYEITILSNQPRIFAHLGQRATLATFEGHKRDPDQAYLIKNIMLPQEHPIWQYMTANNMHTVDWMAINCLKHTLPDQDKQIQLAASPQGNQEIDEIFIQYGYKPEETILIHPGRSWASKTFPARYWNKIINGLIKKGHKPVIIGKDITEKIQGKKLPNLGTVEGLEIPENTPDLRNLLSIDSLISIISRAPILISNDSAPIHIAGAFNNHIILIPTCKHPDFILPWRNGSKYHKAQALYNQPMWEAPCKSPQNTLNYELETIPEGHNILEYLPDPSKIIKTAEEITK